MLIIFKVLFHLICSIGRFFRQIFQVIVGRRHEELGASLSKTEPVTLEHIRIIGEMENDSNRPYQSFTSASKIPAAEWNSWGVEDIFRQQQQQQQQQQQVLTNSPSGEEQVDYFSDIAATVKKTPKIIIKKRVNDNDSHSTWNNSQPSRLQMTNEESVDFQPGLNEWQDEGGKSTAQTWDEDDDFNELSHEANEALRENRRVEREKKIREHQQRKSDKEASRPLPHKREILS